MLFGFFLPGGLVFFVTLICVRQGYVDPWLPQIERLAPYFILGVGFLLGWRFHHSRVAYVIFILMLAERTLYYFGPGGVAGTGSEKVVFDFVAMILPINMGLFYLVKERGVINLRGLMKFLFILIQPLAIYFYLTKGQAVADYLKYNFVGLPTFEGINLSLALPYVFAGIISIFFLGSLLSSKPILRGFFWSLLAIGVALYTIDSGSRATIYFCLAGLIIILSVLETAYAMAYHDELTGLPGRRSLNTLMQGLGRQYTIAMLDIDFFKKFNDRYGHDVGDQVLCMVASHINRVGGGGKPFRYGGEEFTVIFPGKSKEDVIPYLENLREAIAEARFGLRGKNRPKKPAKSKTRKKNQKTVSVTISIGAAESGSNFSKPAEVIKAADKALYRAKKNGRNCVVA